MRIHVVRSGETLSRIAARYRFHSYRSLWDHPSNADLRKQRRSPYILFPGDRVRIPEQRKGYATGATGQRHRFVCLQPTLLLRIVVHDHERQPMGGRPYTLTIGDLELCGTTDPQGLLEETVSVDATQGVLVVDGFEWVLAIGDLNPHEETTDDRGISGIQGRLRNLSYYEGEIDGSARELTQAAVKAFQADHGLKVDGVCGPITSDRLAREHGC